MTLCEVTPVTWGMVAGITHAEPAELMRASYAFDVVTAPPFLDGYLTLWAFLRICAKPCIRLCFFRQILSDFLSPFLQQFAADW